MSALFRIVLTSLAFATLALLAANPAAARKDTLRQWLDGPVHYIITPAELKEFKSLKTDTERAAFVARFWRRRDPTPKTLANEYRQLLWDRVQEANEKFLDSPKPGWRTDRGKIYILYGPPNEVKEDPNATASRDQTDSKGLIRWVYIKPGSRKDADPVVYVPFVRDVSGEYRVSYDPALSSPFFNWNAIDDNRTAGLGKFLTADRSGRDPLGVMLDLGRMQEVPPQEAVLLDEIDTVETFAYLPLPIAIHRFEPEGKGLLAVLTVAIPDEHGSDPSSIIARFSRKDDPHGARLLGEGSFRIEGEGNVRIAQARVSLPAVPWDLTVLAVEPSTGVSRIFRGRVDPLPPGPALRVSDVVLASSMDPLQYAAQSSYDAPYIVGGFRVTPRAASQVVVGEAVRVFFEVYGGTAPYHVAYQVSGQEKDGTWVALGKAQEGDGTAGGQGFALPTTANWPPGSYRLAVTVTDAAGGKAERVVPWSLVGERAP